MRKMQSSKGKKPLESQQLAEIFVANEKTDSDHRRQYLTLRNHNQSMLLNMLEHRALKMDQNLTGAFIIS